MVLEALGALTSIAGTAYGLAQSNKKNSEANAQLAQQKAENQRWWNIKRAENGVNKNYNQAILARFDKQAQDNLQQVNATNAVAGGTNERFAAAQEAEGNAKSELLSNMSSDEARLKESEEQSARAVDSQLTQQQIAVKQQEAANASQAGSAALTAGMNLIGAGVDANTGSASSSASANTKMETKTKKGDDFTSGLTITTA